MAPQFTASTSCAYSSLLRLPLSPPSPFRNRDLISKRCTTTCWKKNHALPSAGISLEKSYTPLPAVSSPLFTHYQARLSLKAPLSQRCSAYIYHDSGFRIPANAERPEWWWRTLSCIPYLVALHMSATGFYLGPLMEKFPLFENLVYFIPGAVNRLPTWFPILYCYLAVVFVVKNRNLPLLFRFHMMMGMLLEIAQQIVWVSSNFMPLIHFKGTLGVYYWAGVALAYILVMMECIRNRDLISKRCTTTCWKKNHALPSAGISLEKSYTPLPAVSSPLFTHYQARLSLKAPLSQRCSKICGQAYIYHDSGFRIPANAERPEWWWRTLSCIPYLVALHMSATGFYLGPLMEKFPLFENLVYFIPGAVNRLPTWFPILYCYLAVVFVVKNRNLPLLFRFHMMMGMLLEIAQQIVWVSSNFMPLIHFKGTLGVYYWAGVALAYILVMMECIRCALLGTFVKIPLVSESAFIHSLFGVN